MGTRPVRCQVFVDSPAPQYGLGGGAASEGYFLLSHAGTHPNILWIPDKEKGNWIPEEILAGLLPSFRWSPDEIARMIRAVHYSDWGYHTVGECLDVLFYEDPNIVSKLHISIKLLLPDPEE